VDSVGPGSVLAGRYHVQERVHQGTWSSIWQALDETLDRPVSLRVVDAGHPRGSDVLDAARRAAGVEDPRLQRVLDVGVEDGLTYVVCEWVGADSLTDLLRSGLPSPDEVRRLVGEAATALEAARHRGLHHLAITPDTLLRGHDGPITVTGLAIDAALAGTEIADADEASRRDAVALVSLIYAGLTGRWPLDPVPGLEPPPRVSSALPAPTELASGVPADLDALCVQTLRNGAGPTDPGQLATQLAPWAAGPVMAPHRTVGAFPISLHGDTAPATTVLPAVGEARSVQATVAAAKPPPPPAPPARPPSTHVPPATTDPGIRPPGFAPPMLPSPADASAAPPPASTWPPIPVVRAAAPASPPATAPAAPPAAPAAPVPAAAAPATAATAPMAAMAARPAGLMSQVPDAEPPAPLLPAAPTTRPPEAQTRAVLAVVLIFVLVLCLLAYCGLRSFGSGDNKTGTAQPSRTAGTSTSPSGSASSTGSGSPTSGSAPGALLRIQKASGFDPQGDGSEKESLTKLAYDAKPSTGWTSDTYQSIAWGGLKKGVGLRLDLGSAKTIHSAQLRIGGTGASIQLLAVKGDSLSGSTVLAQRAGVQGSVTLTVTKAVTTRYVVIWFTKPGQFNDGYRAEVDDVRLR
jgi:eukaryotic-like serine/threonine-protein kinase